MISIKNKFKIQEFTYVIIRCFLDFVDALHLNHIDGKDSILKDTEDNRLGEKKPWRHFSLLSFTLLAFPSFLYVNRD